jgi:16S rRNA (cytosine1402-N4)-methyltransferase
MHAASLSSDSIQPTQASGHIPVMLEQVLAFLQPCLGGDILDGTLGGGGHAAALLEAGRGKGRLLGLDRDPHALLVARQRLAPFVGQYITLHTNFSQAAAVLREVGWAGVDGLLLDLGFSSLQVEDGERGFSFLRPGPLDMRMDQSSGQSAADIVNASSEEELYRILREYGEERAARVIARAILQERIQGPITTTTALVKIIERSVRRPARHQRHRVHAATQTFQALRIAVNQELQHLAVFLQEGYTLLRPGGRMVVLSYHSLEDRLVKTAFRRWASACICPPQLQVCACDWEPQVRVLTPKPLTPTGQEVMENTRARSARLRAVERCEGGG